MSHIFAGFCEMWDTAIVQDAGYKSASRYRESDQWAAPVIFVPRTLWRTWGTRRLPLRFAATQTPIGTDICGAPRICLWDRVFGWFVGQSFRFAIGIGLLASDRGLGLELGLGCVLFLPVGRLRPLLACG